MKENTKNPQPISIDDMTDLQYQAWRTIEKNWLVQEFNTILANHNLVQDCIVCDDIFCQALIRIGTDGSVQSIEVLDQKINCQKLDENEIESLREEILGSFKSCQFAEPLYDQVLKAKIGRPSKC